VKLFQKHKVSLEELIKGCVENDRRSQELLYKRFFALALRIVRRYSSDEETQLHIVNEGFLRVFTKISNYQGTGSFEGWLGKLIFHEVSNHFRKKQSNFKFIEVDSNHTQAVRNQGHDSLEYADLEAEVKALPEASQKVFMLFAIEGYSHKEISEKLNISEGTSKWHVSNARSILKKRLTKRDQNDWLQLLNYE
jgi:RNA polymerase sigma-70 factor (ECF subfamily)